MQEGEGGESGVLGLRPPRRKPQTGGHTSPTLADDMALNSALIPQLQSEQSAV